MLQALYEMLHNATTFLRTVTLCYEQFTNCYAMLGTFYELLRNAPNFLQTGT